MSLRERERQTDLVSTESEREREKQIDHVSTNRVIDRQTYRYRLEDGRDRKNRICLYRERQRDRYRQTLSVKRERETTFIFNIWSKLNPAAVKG